MFGEFNRYNVHPGLGTSFLETQLRQNNIPRLGHKFTTINKVKHCHSMITGNHIIHAQAIILVYAKYHMLNNSLSDLAVFRYR